MGSSWSNRPDPVPEPEVIPVVDPSPEEKKKLFSTAQSIIAAGNLSLRSATASEGTKTTDLVKAVTSSVRKQISDELCSIIEEGVKKINTEYQIYVQSSCSPTASPASLEIWLNNQEDQYCYPKWTYADIQRLLVAHQDAMEVIKKSKKPSELTEEEKSKLRPFEIYIAKVLNEDEVQQYIKELCNALQHELLFLQFFFVEFKLFKFWEKRSALRVGIQETVFERAHNKLITEYNNTAPTVQLLLMSTSGNSPIIEFFCAFLTKFGANHAALQVGPYIIDWHDGQLVLPRQLKSSGAVFRLPYRVPSTMTSHELYSKVAQVCVHFTTKVRYSRYNSSDSHKNCHGFVDAVIANINAQPSWSAHGPVASFFQSVKDCKMPSSTSFIIMDGKESVPINNLKELRSFWNRIRVDTMRSDLQEMELIVKSIERCYTLQYRQALARNDEDKMKLIRPDGDGSQLIQTSDHQPGGLVVSEITGDLGSAVAVASSGFSNFSHLSNATTSAQNDGEVQDDLPSTVTAIMIARQRENRTLLSDNNVA